MITIMVFLLLAGGAVYVWRSERFQEYTVANLAPLIRNGLDAECQGTFVKADDRGEINPEWFHSRTLILGLDKKRRRGAADALFRFPLPHKLLSKSSNVSAYLSIEAERIHGGLHSKDGPKSKRARIDINGKTVDQFWLIDKMPNGAHYGYRNVGPILINHEFLSADNLDVRLIIEEQTAWDIDRVLVQITKGEARLTVFGSMLLGALVSAALGLSPAFIQAVDDII